MDTSFKQTVKNVVFLWGAISLGLIILVIVYMMTSNIRHSNKQPAKSEETLHEKTFGDVKLDIVAIYGDQDPKVLINVTQNNKKFVEKYLLPTHEKGFDYVRFDDSVVVTTEPGKYHITLFSSGELEDSSTQVWFLSLDDHMKFIRVDDLFDMRRPKSGRGPIFGNKHLRFPYIGESSKDQYVVPVEINPEETIKITSLLNDRAAKLLRTDFEQEVAYINNELKKFPDQSTTEAARNRAFMPYEQFMKKVHDVQQEFNEALQGNSIAW